MSSTLEFSNASGMIELKDKAHATIKYLTLLRSDCLNSIYRENSTERAQSEGSNNSDKHVRLWSIRDSRRKEIKVFAA